MSDPHASPPAPPAHGFRRLRAGHITALLDLESGSLRRICLGDIELVRSIYGAVRDRDWGTVPPQVDGLEVIEGEDRFEVRFYATCRNSEIDFEWRGTLLGTAEGRIEYHFDGVARRDFLRNRIGLCVLHPAAGCAGKPCRVEHTDGRHTYGRFPDSVSPHQPFLSFCAINHEAAPGIRVEVRFEGDDFEMEDQRNWTDASFKTYSTPLARPFPVAVPAGARIRQSVVVNVTAESLPVLPVSAGHDVNIQLRESLFRMRPSLGVEWVPAAVVSSFELAALRELALDHLRVELRPAAPDWRRRVAAMRVAAAELPALRWHVAVFLEDAPGGALELLAAELATEPRLKVSLFLVLPDAGKVTSPAVLEAARRRFGPLFPGADFAAGTDAYCAELNRQRPAPDQAALPCFSINPQVHAFDDLSLMETLAAQPDAAATVAGFAGKPVVISPVTLLPRFNPNATSPAGKAVPRAADPRQATDFCAAWTLGSLARLAVQDAVHSLTYYELEGVRGLFRHQPAPGGGCTEVEKFPVFGLFRALAGFTWCGRADNSAPDRVAALHCLSPEGQEQLLLANLTAGEQIVHLWRADGGNVPTTGLILAGAATPAGAGGEWRLGAYACLALPLAGTRTAGVSG